MNKYLRKLCFILFLIMIYIGVHLLEDRQYNLIATILVIISLLCFYYKYERGHPLARDVVVLSVMVALVVIGRLVFMVTPSFKPTLALIIIYAMSFGSISGFTCGSLSAFISNFFYGQGPWTPFQMLACGIVGYFAGMFNRGKYLSENLYLRLIYGILSAVVYSLLMDIWSVLAMDGIFNIQRYIALVISSLPVMGIYILSNMIFLYGLTPTMLKKLDRIKLKYGLEERN